MKVLLMAAALLMPCTAFALDQWNDGSPSDTEHRCILGIDLVDQQEDLVWTWVGYFGLPQQNQVYYARVLVGGLGCSGALARPEVKLPKATRFAIDASHPVRCYYEGHNRPKAQFTDGCPSAPGNGHYPYNTSSVPNAPGSGYDNEYHVFAPTSQPYWPLPGGAILTIEFPVQSADVLSGFASNDYLLAAVDVLDNNPGGPTQQWDGPPLNFSGIPSTGAWQGVFVSAGTFDAPYIVYPEPSTENAIPDGGHPGRYQITNVIYVYNWTCINTPTATFTLEYTDGTSSADVTFSGGFTDDANGRRVTGTWYNLLPGKQVYWHSVLGGSLPKPGGCPDPIVDVSERYFTVPGGVVRRQVVTQVSGNGTVALSPEGGSYAAATSVTVTATPASGSTFTQWKVDGVAQTTNPLVLTIADDDYSVIAEFSTPAPATTGSTTGDTTAGGTTASTTAGATTGSTTGATTGVSTSSGPSLGSDTPATPEKKGCASTGGDVAVWAALLSVLMSGRARALRAWAKR